MAEANKKLKPADALAEFQEKYVLNTPEMYGILAQLMIAVRLDQLVEEIRDIQTDINGHGVYAIRTYESSSS